MGRGGAERKRHHRRGDQRCAAFWASMPHGPRLTDRRAPRQAVSATERPTTVGAESRAALQHSADMLPSTRVRPGANLQCCFDAKSRQRSRFHANAKAGPLPQSGGLSRPSLLDRDRRQRKPERRGSNLRAHFPTVHTGFGRSGRMDMRCRFRRSGRRSGDVVATGYERRACSFSRRPERPVADIPSIGASGTGKR